MLVRTALVLTLAAVLAPSDASAQSTLVAARGPVATAPTSIPLTPYTGTYTTAEGRIELVAQQGTLRLQVTGAPVAAAIAHLSPSPSLLDVTSETLIAAWVAGDIAPLAAAVAPNRQRVAADHFAASREALVRQLGAGIALEIAGTFRKTDGGWATLVRLDAERGSEWMSLVWTDTHELATVKRGLNPVFVGTARPVARDVFEISGTSLTFGRDATGRVQSLTIGTHLVATR